MIGAGIQHIRVPHWSYISITIIVAALLSVVPLPESAKTARPDWFMLVVFYWVLVLPMHLGVVFGWLVGLVEDIMSFSVLGQHALVKSLMGTIAGMIGHKFWLFNFIEKMLLIFILQSISIGLNAWINLLAFEMPIHADLWLSAVSTALIWPVVFFLLDQFDPNTN